MPIKNKWKPQKDILWSYYKYDVAVCPKCGEVICLDFSTTSEAQANWDKEHLPHYCEHCGTNMFLDEGPQLQSEISSIIEDMRFHAKLKRQQDESNKVYGILTAEAQIIEGWANRLEKCK